MRRRASFRNGFHWPSVPRDPWSLRISIGQFWNPLKDCALGSLFVMNETLEKSFESSKFDQNRMQKRIGLNMAAFGADSILWATCELYKKNKDKFDDERMVSFITFDPKLSHN